MRLGIEVEFTGISTRETAKLVAEYFDSEVEECIDFVDGEARDSYKVEDYNGQVWKVVEDRSINSDNCEFDHCCELISPVLEEFDELYDLLEILRLNGGKVNDTCGIHIHIDKLESLKMFSLISEFFNIQDDVVQGFNIPRVRLSKYCKVYPRWFINSFLNRFNNSSSIDEMLDYFYSSLGNDEFDKNKLRYYLLNLDSIRKIGTIEFRMFNSTLDETDMEEHIEWVKEFVSSV